MSSPQLPILKLHPWSLAPAMHDSLTVNLDIHSRTASDMKAIRSPQAPP